ncbi:MAG: thioredoxin family protein [Bacteroidales bacterium]
MMKHLLTFLVCILFSVPFNAQNTSKNSGVLFEEGTFAQVLAKAKNNKKGPKIIFMDCYTSWCGPCKKMAETIFPQEHVGKFFNTNFVNYKIDMEKGEGVELAKKYNVKAYPTFLILDANGNEINRIVGGGEADAFIEKAKKAMDPANNPLAIKAKYESAKTLDNAIDYLEALRSSFLIKEADEFFEVLFTNMIPTERYSDKMWPYVFQTLQNTNSKVFEMVLDEKQVADKIASKERVDVAICYGLKSLAGGYTTGRIKNADHNKIMAKLNYLNLLSGKDETATYYINIAKYFGENNMDAIAGMLKVRDLMRLGENERSSVERLIISVKGLPKEKILEYYKAKQEYYKIQIDQLSASIEASSKVK